MKKILILLISSLLLTSCNPSNSGISSEEIIINKTFATAHFDDLTVDFDGNPHILNEVQEVPEGTKITYDGRDSFVEVGIYPATAHLEKEGYDSLTLSATLTISPIDFSNIIFLNSEVEYDGLEHEIVCSGVPSFATVTYENNAGTEVGVYNATATITAPNYNDLVLHATLTITAPLLTFDEAKMDDLTIDYDGQNHTIEPYDIPEGTKVSYKGTYSYRSVGSYTISCTISKEGYKNKDLSATLTINSADLTGVTFDDLTVLYDGENHSITVKNAPSGSTVTYRRTNGSGTNTFKDAGSYEIEATIKAANYNTLTLCATLNIINGAELISTDHYKSAYQISEPLMWDPIFNELMKGNYTLHYKSGYWDSFTPDVKNDYSAGTIIGCDGVNSCNYEISENGESEAYEIYTNCGDDVVYTIGNTEYHDSQTKFPSEAMNETVILYHIGRAFVGVQRYEDGRIINGVDLDDYYGDEGRAELINGHLVITMEHPRTLDNGEYRYFYRIYDFYNIGNTKLNIPEQFFLSKEEIEDLTPYRDYYVGGVKYGYHLVSTYNSPYVLMAHTYLNHFQQLILEKGVHFVNPDVYGDVVLRVVFYYYTERQYNYNMSGYILNVYFDEEGNYQGEYASYGSTTDKTSGFVNYGGEIRYYDEWHIE